MILDTYLYTNQGSREENEDSAFFRIEDNHGIFLVADGLGGHRYGKLASECVVSSLTDAWLPEDMPNRNAWLNQQIETANEKLLQLQNEYQSKMKSTLVVLTVDKEKAFWAHVGDSRLYYFHNYSLQATTADHSVSYKKYKAGEITKAQINTDEDQSCLLRSLGGTEHWNPEIGRAHV